MRFFLFSMLLLLVSSCGDNNKILEIDNPTDAAIALSFDEGTEGAQAFEIQPQQNMQIVLASGKHQVKIGEEDAVEIDMAAKGDFLFNPSRSNYIVEEIWYGPETASAMIEALGDKAENMMGHKLPKTTIEVMGFPLEGHFKKIEGDLMIKQIWEIGVTEKAPETIQTEANNSFGEGILKVHRENEYIMALFEAAMQAQADSVGVEPGATNGN